MNILSMRWKTSALLAATVALLTSGLFFLSRVGAQELPGFPMIYSGSVTIAGEPAPDGLQITARIEGKTFGPVQTTRGRYLGLTVNGTRDDNGKTVAFYLREVAKADQEDTFIFATSPRTGKTLNIAFSFLPEFTPTPTATPTITPTPTVTPTPLPIGPLAMRLAARGGDAVGLGEEFTVDVVATPDRHRILRGEAAVSFDPRYVRLLSATTGSLLPQAVNAATVGETLVQVVFFQVEPTQPLLQEGSLVTLKFRARRDAPAGTTDFTMTNVKVVDHLGQQFALDLRSLTLRIALHGVPGDINKDGRVDVVDLALLGAAYGSRQGDTLYNPSADLNEDGRVDSQDVSILRSHYGEGA